MPTEHAFSRDATSARRDLVEFYSVHNPAKLKDVDTLLATFAGREDAMMAALREKYVNQRLPTDGPGSNAARVGHASVDKGSPERHNRVARLRELLADMGGVDLAALATHLEATVEDEGQHALLLKHIIAYVEHISYCASEFLRVARQDVPPMKNGLPSSADQQRRQQQDTASPGRPPPRLPSLERFTEAARDRQEVSASPSPPSVTRTDTQSASPLASPTAERAGAVVGDDAFAQAARPPPSARGGREADAVVTHPSFRLPSAPGGGGGALRTSAGRVRGRIHALAPAASHASVVSPACGAAQSGDCVELQPGLYYESITLEDCGSLEVTAAFPGAPVVLRPASDAAPALHVKGSHSRVTVRGVVFVVGDVTDAAADAAVPRAARPSPAPRQDVHSPLVLVEDGAALRMEGCHVYNGGAGGVVASGAGTRVRLSLCLVSLCTFAGVYAHGGAVVEVSQSRVKNSECGVRATGASTVVRVEDTVVEGNRTDGVVVDGPSCVCVVERSTISNSGGSGLYLAKGSEMRLLGATVELNAVYGVHRCRGSRLHLHQSFVRDNGLLPINEERS